MKKLETELALSKNTRELSLDHCVKMQRQCWANAQYSQHECVEVARTPQSLPASDLEKTFSKILEKGGIKVPAEDTDACHWVGKQGYVIVKFLRRKDCQQVLSMKKNIQKIIATDLDLPNTTIKLYLNESLYPYYHILWSKRKALLTMDKIDSYIISNGSVKIHLQEQGTSVPITHKLILKSIFLVRTWVLQDTLGLHL